MNSGHDKFSHPDVGMEFDYLLLGANGELIFLSTAGYGPVPPESMDLVGVPLCTKVLELDATTDFVREVHDGDYTEWDEIARRGFFAFDWCTSTDRFKLIARPKQPRTLQELPAGTVREVALKARVIDEEILGRNSFIPSWA